MEWRSSGNHVTGEYKREKPGKKRQIMEYEIVDLKEKSVFGFAARTNNHSEDCMSVIGGLWQKFYSEGGYDAILEKTDGKSLGIYSDYENGAKGDYTVTVACEAAPDAQVPEKMVHMVIPAGKYAKFIVKGNMHEAVGRFWQELWAMDLDRTFVCDFEEYQNSDMENAEIHMYIGIK